jgi:hypothetical protein
MKVYIPAVNENCPAALALRKEGVPFELVLMPHEYSYSDMLCELWKKQQTFISIEHDVVPWWGAIEQLWKCPQPWCSYEYPPAPKALYAALGCIKIRGELPRQFPEICKVWENREWGYLDGLVCSVLQGIVGKTHIHKPPLAHVKL